MLMGRVRVPLTISCLWATGYGLQSDFAQANGRSGESERSKQRRANGSAYNIPDINFIHILPIVGSAEVTEGETDILEAARTASDGVAASDGVVASGRAVEEKLFLNVAGVSRHRDLPALVTALVMDLVTFFVTILLVASLWVEIVRKSTRFVSTYAFFR